MKRKKERIEANVLVVEDEELTNALIVRHLESIGNKDLKIQSFSEAWGLWEKDLSKVQVAVVDILLPKVNGLDLIKELKKNYPNMAIVPITGMAPEPMKRAIRQLLPEGQKKILDKPLRKQEFLTSFLEAKKAYEDTQQRTRQGLSDNVEADESLWTVAENTNSTTMSVVKGKLGSKSAA